MINSLQFPLEMPTPKCGLTCVKSGSKNHDQLVDPTEVALQNSAVWKPHHFCHALMQCHELHARVRQIAQIKALDCRALLEHNLSNSPGVLRPDLNSLCA